MAIILKTHFRASYRSLAKNNLIFIFFGYSYETEDLNEKMLFDVSLESE